MDPEVPREDREMAGAPEDVGVVGTTQGEWEAEELTAAPAAMQERDPEMVASRTPSLMPTLGLRR
jgi:hypothetical protein